MDRPLLKDEDFIRYKDRLIYVKLYESIDGKKKLTGKLIGRSDGYLHIEDEKGKVLDLPREKVSKINLTIVF